MWGRQAGLAAHIALISEVCEREDLGYNLVLLATPDEERYSAGMFAGVEVLEEIRAQFGLNYELTICSEPSFGAYRGRYGRDHPARRVSGRPVEIFLYGICWEDASAHLLHWNRNTCGRTS